MNTSSSGADPESQALMDRSEQYAAVRTAPAATVSAEAFQALMAALCKSYGTQREAGVDFLPVADRGSVTPTDIMTMTSSLLKAANLAVFELGMWQSWTGR